MKMDKGLFNQRDLLPIRELDTVSDVTYVGRSYTGIDTSSESWVITKVTNVGNYVSIRYATGSWDNRLTLNYI